MITARAGQCFVVHTASGPGHSENQFTDGSSERAELGKVKAV